MKPRSSSRSICSEALTEAISMTQPRWHDEALAQGRHMTVEQEFKPVPMIACNGGEIREVVTNLIFNAVDALPQGGRIVVRAYSQEQSAVFEVQDDGIGMTEEVRVRCMEPFVTTKGERGTGLGSPWCTGLCSGIMDRSKSKASSAKGHWFECVCLSIEAQRSHRQSEGSSKTRKLRILLVDDEQVVRDVISLFLRHEEHDVEVTPTAIDALRLVREQDVRSGDH